MSTKENKELMRRGFMEWGNFRGDVAKVRPWYEKYCTPDFVIHTFSAGDMNREQRITVICGWLSAFPDLSLSIDDIIAEGDQVALRYTLQGTHKGKYGGILATGRHIVVKGAMICKLTEGKCFEAWDFPDAQGMMRQLGVLPPPAPTK